VRLPLPYRALCGLVGAALVAAGLFLVLLFFVTHAPGSDPAIPTGPVGLYFAALGGCALVGWGGSLLAALRGAGAARGAGTASVLALVLGAVLSLSAWVLGDYHVWPGELLRSGAAGLLLLALAFTWARPRRAAAAPGDAA